MRILTLNAGSSSMKAELFEVASAAALDSPVDALWSGSTDGTSSPDDSTVEALLQGMWDGPDAVIGGPADIDAVGHRVVHGGSVLTTATAVDPTVLDTIRSLTELAPAHNPANIRGIELATRVFPAVSQVAVFDTSFHATLPPGAYTFAGPRSWLEDGIRRYGFHGISHRYVTHRAAAMLGRGMDELRVVSCHLGNGCSLAAVERGVCIDTTMGFTPLDGLVMGSRSGAVDPGVLLHLQRRGASADELDDLLNHRSGLLGLSGVSSDMRAVRSAASSRDRSALLAIEVFEHRLRGQIAAMAAAMNGLDVLVFTAGIGEHDADLRAETAAGLSFLGVELDALRNGSTAGDADIGAEGALVRSLVVRTRENWAIACDTAAVVRRRDPLQGRA